MKKLPDSMLGQGGTSPYWMCLGVVSSLFVRGTGLFSHDCFVFFLFIVFIDPIFGTRIWNVISLPSI